MQVPVAPLRYLHRPVGILDSPLLVTPWWINSEYSDAASVIASMLGPWICHSEYKLASR